ncbi:MAG: hypothetical protein ACJA0U_000965 [Salibacteraceae bacterium]|jgi:hypothetical protein
MKLKALSLFESRGITHSGIVLFSLLSFNTTTYAQCPNDNDCDGIVDLNDFDDDNDGITDIDELSNCINFSTISTTGQLLYDENFGTGSNWGPELAPGTISYCYQNALAPCPQPIWVQAPQVLITDGQYSVLNNPNFGFSDAFRVQDDHTPNDVDGYQVVINADFTPGEIFRKNNIAIPSSNFQVQTVVFSAWISNIGSEENQNYCASVGGLISPNVDFILEDNFGNPVGTPISTGSLPFANDGDDAWIQYTAAFQVTGISSVNIVIKNNAPGGCGNDLGLDDISLYYADVDCDFDGDGISDYLDLDSDNDGIFDVVEGGDGSADTNGDGMINSSDIGFLDSDFNGVDDSSELTSPIHSDNDGLPDYLDLDSDDDGCFDTAEAGHSDSDNDGILGTSPVVVDWNGMVLNQNGYTGTTSAVTTPSSLSSNTITYSAGIYLMSDNNELPILTGSSGGIYSAGSGLDIDSQTGEIYPSTSSPGVYTVVYSTGIPCENDVSFELEILADPVVVEPTVPFTVHIPNIISLNSTVGNDIWFITHQGVSEYKCVIVNRWGNSVFESTDPDEPWYGTTMSGNKVNDGVYFYLIKILSVNGDDIDKHGHITVVY